MTEKLSVVVPQSTPPSLAESFEAEGYERHHNDIDAEIAKTIACEKCGGECEYIGLALWPESGSGMWVMPKVYRAISRCKDAECRHEVEF